ncbi:MAG: GNAT family N-acetyltransferase [Bacteroidota bacterium]
MEYDPFDVRGYPTLSAEEGYDEWAGTYDESVEPEMDLRLLERITEISWNSIRSSVDLACGTGRIGQWLKSKGVQAVHGIDFSEKMLEQARAISVYEALVKGNILQTHFPRASYELAIEVLTDEHLESVVPLYEEASRLLQAGGHFVVVGYHPFFLMNGLVTHFHRQDGEAIAIRSYVHLTSHHIQAAQAAGFSLVRMEEGIVDEAWLTKKPKWGKYRSRPVSFLLVWKKETSNLPHLQLETDRLLMRPADLRDADFTYHLVNSPKWLQYIGDRGINNRSDACQYIADRMLPQLAQRGFGNYTVIRKSDGVKLGCCGLYEREGLKGVDLGFAFLPEYEGQGYGQESAKALLQAGIETFGIPLIQGITLPANQSSRNLLEKIGFHFAEMIQLPDDPEELMLYRYPASQ